MTAYLTVPEVAAIMRCHDWTVRRRIKEGELPAVFEGGKFLVAQAALDAYLESRAVRKPAGATRRRRRSA